jgi:HEAT repeat protein
MSRGRDAAAVRLRELLNRWDIERSPAAVVALGDAGLALILDSLDGKLDLWAGTTETEGREYDDARRSAVAAFAQADLGGVLRKLEARGWSELRIALSGVGRVTDARIVPILLRVYASGDPLDRCAAVNALAYQQGEPVEQALTRALRDRSSGVRAAAALALKERATAERETRGKRSAPHRTAGTRRRTSRT